MLPYSKKLCTSSISKYFTNKVITEVNIYRFSPHYFFREWNDLKNQFQFKGILNYICIQIFHDIEILFLQLCRLDHKNRFKFLIAINLENEKYVIYSSILFLVGCFKIASSLSWCYILNQLMNGTSWETKYFLVLLEN